ncbi:MAG: pyridoxal phosphate-dependent aminotransferase [Alphaproteobacteria bacterium]|nr:pyridoxal phosphate-dependent aminotransferase [Alphaproteobacteria bacterium]
MVLERAKKIEESGAYVYHLELGNPRQPAPREVMDKTIDALQQHAVGYTYSAGHPTLRQAVARRFSKHAGRPVTEANVAISPANLLISQFLELACDPGDRVVFFTPAFPTYWAAAAYVGLDVVSVPLDHRSGFDLSHRDVETALAANPKAILVNSANNPTGAVYSREVLEHLVGECERRGIFLLSDETYAEVAYSKPFFSVSRIPSRFALVMGSFSKMFSIPGFRTGFALGDPELIEKISLSTSTLISCLPVFTQLGAAAGLGVLDTYTASVRARCAAAVANCHEILRGSNALSYGVPVAGFYFFVDIGATGLDDMSFAKRLLEERHTAVTPGRSFGAAYTGFVRIATCGRIQDVLEGTRRLAAFADSLVAEGARVEEPAR